MTDRERDGLGDGQGTQVGMPAPGRAKETDLNAGATSGSQGAAQGGAQNPTEGDGEDNAARAKQAPNAGRTSDAEREPRSTGAGSEASEGILSNGGGHDHEHRSGYGGSGGKPVESSDTRE